jgi:hypothetical protein
MENFSAIFRTAEDFAARTLQPLRAHLSAIGGFLVVLSFIDNGSHGVTHWQDTIWYLHKCILVLHVHAWRSTRASNRRRRFSKDLSNLLYFMDVVVSLPRSRAEMKTEDQDRFNSGAPVCYLRLELRVRSGPSHWRTLDISCARWVRPQDGHAFLVESTRSIWGPRDGIDRCRGATRKTIHGATLVSSLPCTCVNK